MENFTNLIIREQFWIDKTKCYMRDIGYNLQPIAGSNLGFKYSEESKAKMSAWQIGRKMSQAAVVKMSITKRQIDKWPCKDGSRCKCTSCSNKIREYKKLKARKYRERTK